MQALMLAASVDGVSAVQLLLKHGATIELQVRLINTVLKTVDRMTMTLVDEHCCPCCYLSHSLSLFVMTIPACDFC